MRLVAQLVELDPTTGQLEIFYRHSEARRIARNDLIAEYKKRKERDGKVIIKELRPWFNAVKDKLHDVGYVSVVLNTIAMSMLPVICTIIRRQLVGVRMMESS